jgi:hypothetical protein
MAESASMIICSPTYALVAVMSRHAESAFCASGIGHF